MPGPLLRRWDNGPGTASAAGLAPLCADREHKSMTTESPQPGGTRNSGRPGRLRARADGRPQHSAVGDQMRTVTVRGWSLRVAVRGGIPGWSPLLLCNGIGASLELLQPFVDALDPRREVVRFDMPGIGGSSRAVGPYHPWTLAPLVGGLLDQ